MTSDKERKTYRLDFTHRKRLEVLSVKYGNASESIRAAIDLLWEQEGADAQAEYDRRMLYSEQGAVT